MKTVLVVEDNADFRSLVSEMLDASGYRVLTADNGKMAQDIYDLQPIDFVVTDINMPVINGLELISWMKKNGKPAPILVMTGNPDEVLVAESQQVGANGFLMKPFSRQTFEEAIGRIFKP